MDAHLNDPEVEDPVCLIFTGFDGPKAGLVEATFLGRVPSPGGMIARFQTEDGEVFDETQCWWEPAGNFKRTAKKPRNTQAETPRKKPRS